MHLLPKDIYTLIPEPCEYVSSCENRDVAEVIEDLEMGNYSG